MGGMTAGIYAARREMKTLIIGKEVGGQLIWASEIENYPGFKKVNSADLILKVQEQARDMGVEIKVEEVKKIEKEGGGFVLYVGKEKYKAKTVIITMGLAPRRLAIPGEERFSGRGVSYCANCDGPFYKGKVVAVVGGGNAAMDAAEVMSKIARKVYLIHRREEFKCFESLAAVVAGKDNVEIILNSNPKEIIGGVESEASGNGRVQKIIITDSKTQAERELAVDGVFIEVGRVAHTDLVAELVERDCNNQIIVDNKNMTRTPGLFAAGDVTAQSEFKQITIALGQATIAALAAYQYLQLKGKSK